LERSIGDAVRSEESTYRRMVERARLLRTLRA